MGLGFDSHGTMLLGGMTFAVSCIEYKFDSPAPVDAEQHTDPWIIWTYIHGYHLNLIQGGYYPRKVSKPIVPIRPLSRPTRPTARAVGRHQNRRLRGAYRPGHRGSGED